MHTFKINKGEQWAGSIWSRHRAGVSGIRRVSDYTDWIISLDMSGCPTGFTMKVCGLAWLYPSFKRISKRGWSDLFSFTHEESDRLIATRTDDGDIQLRPYSYVGAEIQSGRDAPICIVQDGEQFRYELTIEDFGGSGATRVTHWLWTGSSGYTENAYRRMHQRHLAATYRERDKPILCHRSFAHARGYGYKVAPADIQIKARVL